MNIQFKFNKIDWNFNKINFKWIESKVKWNRIKKIRFFWDKKKIDFFYHPYTRKYKPNGSCGV